MIELSEETGRDIIVDGSLYGMGRGAGNAKTELLAYYINKHCNGKYDIQKLLETIDRYITPELKNLNWGYDLPMYVCGTKHAHVDNVYHLKRNIRVQLMKCTILLKRYRHNKGQDMEQDILKQIFNFR